MPVVKISLLEGVHGSTRVIADAIHQALVESIGIPSEDRFQIISELSPKNLIFDRSFADVTRSQDFVMIEISLAAGRSTETKVHLYEAIAHRLTETCDISADDVFVSLHEVGVADFSLGAGRAQFVERLPPHLQALEDNIRES